MNQKDSDIDAMRKEFVSREEFEALRERFLELLHLIQDLGEGAERLEVRMGEEE